MMQPRRLIALTVVLGLFLGTMALSLLAIQADQEDLGRVRLFFQDQRTTDIHPELRVIPRRGSRTQEVASLVRALVAGPQDLTLRRVIPSQTRLKAIHVKGGTVWLSFDQLFQAPDPLCPPDMAERMDLMRRTILFNHPDLDRVEFILDNTQVIGI